MVAAPITIDAIIRRLKCVDGAFGNAGTFFIFLLFFFFSGIFIDKFRANSRFCFYLIETPSNSCLHRCSQIAQARSNTMVPGKLVDKR
uniref:Uncharacterized protein n=1 Tax=Rhizophora mucronata TaxID=61149 RepID=A0A2P2KK32_RHIMU